MWIKSASIPFLIVICSIAQVNLSGTIVNQAQTPVKGLVISLLSSQVIDTTDEQGMFHLLQNETSASHVSRSYSQFLNVSGDKISLRSSAAREQISFELYGIDGAQITKLQDMRPGQTISLSKYLHSSKMHIAVIKCNDQIYQLTIIKLNNNKVLIRNRSQNLQKTSSFSRTGQINGDTLVIKRKEMVEFKEYRTSLIDALSLTLDLIPYEAVELANDEQGRYPDEVGQQIDYYPYAVANYLAKTGDGTHDYEAWCSEFASWVYRAAGYQLTGGSQGGWMLRGSTGLRSWFRNNTQFIDRDSQNWNTFVPAPGDYVRYDNDAGGHSGIVRYTSNDTLYTVEGNVSNKVYIRRIPQWKTYQGSGSTRIDGIGRRSGTLVFL